MAYIVIIPKKSRAIIMFGQYKKNTMSFLLNFVQVVRSGKYVERSQFIAETLYRNYQFCKVFIYPEGSGKSFNLKMLQNFLSDKESAPLFANMQIGNYPEYMEKQGKYTVIYLDFSDIADNSEKSFKEKISNLYQEFAYIRDDLPSKTKSEFDAIANGKCTDGCLWELAVFHLAEYITEYNEAHGNSRSKAIILIDGYDTPVNKGINSLISGLYSSIMEGFLCSSDSYIDNVILMGKDLYRDILPNSIYAVYSNNTDDFAGCFGRVPQVRKEEAIQELSDNRLMR